jgi:hypothetical protein
LEKNVKAGSGHVVLKSNFVLASTENGIENSPKSSAFRRSLLSKRENGGGRSSRDVTPTPQQ